MVVVVMMMMMMMVVVVVMVMVMKCLYDEMKITDEYMFSDGWLQKSKELRSLQLLSDNAEYWIIQHLPSLVRVRSVRFYCVY
jgi:hypothetical protein